MKDYTTFIGLDTHKKTISAAILTEEKAGYQEFTISHNEKGIKKLFKKIRKHLKSGNKVLCCYEAGPCGFTLQRKLRREGIECKVIAPSLIPTKPGERIKTDKRDARKLAELLRAGILTEVHPPTVKEESARDLTRCRGAYVKDLQRVRHRISKFLLKYGISYPKKSKWTGVHKRWLKQVRLEEETSQFVLDSYLLTMSQLEAQIESIESRMEKIASLEKYEKVVSYLKCFKGIKTVAALAIVTELYDFRRFPKAENLMSFLGLVPSENSSGDSTKRGRITKTGNTRLRSLLVQIAWHYIHKPNLGVSLKKRRLGQPPKVIAIADKAQHRLYQRYWHLRNNNGKSKQKAIIAVARELVGFIWSVLFPEAMESEHREVIKALD